MNKPNSIAVERALKTKFADKVTNWEDFWLGANSAEAELMLTIEKQERIIADLELKLKGK